MCAISDGGSPSTTSYGEVAGPEVRRAKFCPLRRAGGAMEQLTSKVLRRAKAAAGRYRRHREKVGKAVEVVDLAREAVSTSAPEQMRKRRMDELLSESKAREMASAAEARGAVMDPSKTLQNIARERIIGSDDLMGLNYLELAVAISRAVCRIRIGSSAGTGVLVGPRVLMTNHHVIQSRDIGLQAEAQFDYQENRSGELLPVQSFRLVPDHFWMTDEELDFTLIGTESISAKGRDIATYPWIRFIESLGKADEGDPVNIIQHPRGGLKQIALRNNNIIEIPRGKPDFLYYTTDTEPGSSGSPCFNNQWELIALHHQAVPATDPGDETIILRTDGQPWREGQDDPALIKWIANEGARTSAIVGAIREEPLGAAQSELRNRFLTEAAPNPVELVRRATMQTSGTSAVIPPPVASGAGVAATARAGSVQFQLPLNIVISLGQPGRPGSVVAGAETPQNPADDGPSTSSVFEEAVKIDPDWKGRKGYLEDFLGVKLPLPRLTQALQRRTVRVPKEFQRKGNSFALDYHNYTVAMNSERCFAWYSAAVVDGDRRFVLPARNDKWFIDPRIEKDVNDPQFQCGEELYATARTDRGHLTRYLDVAWGASKADALRAAHDTLHFTNCCLQIQGFNRSSSRWHGIERFLLEQKAKKEKRRIVVMTGPVFQETDPIYQNKFTSYSVPIPIDFWKLCAIVRPDDTLSVTAFVLSQKDATTLPGFTKEALPTKAIQITVRELERRTGLKFDVFRDHDHLKDGGTKGTLEVARPDGSKDLIMPIRVYEDIVV